MVARNLTTRRPVMVEMTRHVATSRTFEVTASAMLGGNPSPRQTATIGIIVRSFVSQPSFTRVTVLPDSAIEVFDNPADDRCQDDRHDAVARRRGAGTAAGVVGCIDGVEWFRDATHLPTAVSHQAIQLDWFPSGGSTRESSLRVDWVRAYS